MTERFELKLEREKKKMLLTSNLPFFFFSIFSILLKKTVHVIDYNSIYLSFANTSNLDLSKILSFGKGWKVVGKEDITCHVQFYLFPQSLSGMPFENMTTFRK